MTKFKLFNALRAFFAICSLFIIVFFTPLAAAACTTDRDCPPRQRCVQGRCVRPVMGFDLSSNSSSFPRLNTINNSEFSQSCSGVPMLPNNSLF